MKTVKYLLFSALIMVASCAGSKRVKVVDTNFDEEISTAGNISFTFNKNLVPDSLVNLWLENEFIKIKPETEGRCMWTTNSKLVFTPKDGFQPSTDYTCSLTKKILKYKDGFKLKGDVDYEFHTPYLQISNVQAYWTVPESLGGKATVRFDIDFNQVVGMKAVAEQLNIEIEKETRDFRLISDEAGQTVSVMVTGLKPEDKNYPAKITIEKGLKSHRGNVKTTDPFIETFNIPSPFKLNIMDIQANHDGFEGTITVSTSQPVNERDIKQYISIDPFVKYSVEIKPSYFLIKSEEFDADKKYDLTLRKGLSGKIGGELKHDQSQPLSFGQMKPSIQFVNGKEFYVSGKGSRNIEVAIVNVSKINIKIYKIYENNLNNMVRHYNFNSRNSYYSYYYYYGSVNPSQIGDVVYEKEMETSALPRNGNHRVLNLDFEDKIAQYKGVYYIEISSPEKYYLRAKKMVSVSDIGLIVKQGTRHITVFANSIKNTEPLANVELKFIGKNNQVTHTAKTNADGVAVYEYDQLPAPGFETKIVTAKLGSDYNFIPLDKTQVSTSRFDVGGKYENPAGMEAFIYGDRDIYRPGETVNVSAIIRTDKWETPERLPMIMKFITPGGKTLKTARKLLNGHGSFEMQIELLPSAMTGSYTVEVYTSNNMMLGSKRISVEEFVPDRIKVDVSLDKENYMPDETINMDIQADNFFGPPAANRNYEVEWSIKRKYFSPKEYKDYDFSIEKINTYFRTVVREGKTNQQGAANELYAIPSDYKNMGVLQSDLFVTVFDETGRPVNRKKSATIYTQDVYLGIKRSFSHYTKTGQPVRFDLIAVDKDGKALSGIDARVKLIKHEYKTVLSKSGSYFRYRSEKVERIIEVKSIEINKKSTSYTFIPDLSGHYEVRISVPGAYTYVNRFVYAYGWGSTSYSSFQVDNEGQIDIQLDKEKYEVGDKAKVILKAPFSGKILVTVENNKVLRHFYVETDKRAASFELDLSGKYVPNVYVTATLFRPHRKSDIPLMVAHGFAPVLVENPDNNIEIDIEAAEKSRSNTSQIIKVNARPNSAITIAVVDEGILQVTGFDTPDPYGFFYRKRALQVNTSDVYPYLFPEIGMIRSHTGGGGPAMQKRINPLTNKRVKLVAFWSGILETNARGNAEFEIDIPQFSGDLRIMAVAHKNHMFGSGHANMKVADPLVISTALPRFMSPGDTVVMPVVMTNTTNKNASCKTKIEVSGPLKIKGAADKSLKIPSNAEGEVVYKIFAESMIGEAAITVKADALGETFINKTDITVRPASPLQKRNGAGVINAGEDKRISMDIGDFIQSSIDKKLVISKNPLAQFTNSLDYLVRYPYGCVEQTVSAAFPQIYFKNLVNNVFAQKRAGKDAIHNVQHAIDRLMLMQLYNGGMAFWAGEGRETWWGSVYAAHFLTEAKKAGYEVDPDMIDKLYKYLRMRLRKRETITYYYNGNQKRVIAPRSVPYSLYVLALAGESQRSTMNYYRAHKDQLSLDGKYMLAAAYALIGDKRRYKEILPKAFRGERANPSFGGSFYSYIRDEAIALNVLLEADPENPQIGLMAKHISEKLMNSRYLNTQERSFGLLALGKIARMAEESDVSATVKSNSKTIGKCNNTTLTLHTDKLPGESFDIEAKGKGKLYYFWEAEGISATGRYKEEDSYLRVRRTFYNRYGQVITNNVFEQNDLVLVELAVQNGTETKVENVAVTDILPAGFEIENPRITQLPPGMVWPHTRSHATHTDYRDDRIHYFIDLYDSRRPQYYYYLVRAVSRGTYNMGPASADAMYNGEYHSYHGGGTIKITE